MQGLIGKEWRSFLLALQFFTRLHVPSLVDFKETDLNHAAKYFPLVGILVGLFGAAVFKLSAYILPNSIAILLSMAATIYLTGAFHEDGLADSADGLGGGWDQERILTIMQDSRLGTFGAVALFFALFAKFQLLTALPQSVVVNALIIAHALSRLAAVYLMATLSYVKPAGKAKPLANTLRLTEMIVATVLGLLPLALLWGYFFNAANIWMLLLYVLVPVLLGWLWWRFKIKRWLGGYTGDCLGAMQQIAELAVYLGMLAFFGQGYF